MPQLLARDPSLIGALNSSDYQQSTQRLISFVEEIGAANLMLLDRDGRAVAATNRNVLGSTHRSEPYFIKCNPSSWYPFLLSHQGKQTMLFSLIHAELLQEQKYLVSVVVEVDLQKFERAWSRNFCCSIGDR